MRITFDPAKRDATLAGRKLDFAHAARVFADRSLTVPDLRFAYPEPRFITCGTLRGRVVVVVWTPTADRRRGVSMRNADDRERKAAGQRLGIR